MFTVRYYKYNTICYSYCDCTYVHMYVSVKIVSAPVWILFCLHFVFFVVAFDMSERANIEHKQHKSYNNGDMCKS